jgi:hypothetical protein
MDKDKVVRKYVEFRMMHTAADEHRHKRITHLTESVMKEYRNWWHSLNQRNAEAEEDA